MNSHIIQEKISFIPFMGLQFYPGDSGHLKALHIGIPGGMVYFMQSNWSNSFRATMIFENVNSINRYNSGRRYCRSGIGMFMFVKGLLVDFESMDILFIRVKLKGTVNPMWLVSDIFDTPRCPRKYKSMRIHWRKYMMEMVEYGTKISKIDHTLLQKFTSSYNYSPSREEVESLKLDIMNSFDTRPPINVGGMSTTTNTRSYRPRPVGASTSASTDTSDSFPF